MGFDKYLCTYSQSHLALQVEWVSEGCRNKDWECHLSLISAHRLVPTALYEVATAPLWAATFPLAYSQRVGKLYDLSCQAAEMG